MKEDILEIIEEASKDEVVGLRRHVKVYEINVNDTKIEEILLWVRSARVFKRGGKKSVNQELRNMMNARVN